MFSFVNALLEKCKLCFDVSICMKWINLFWTPFVIMNFVNISKKGNKCHDLKVSAKKMIKKCFQVFDFGILKELVIAVGNKSISINTRFHFETIWIRDLGAPRGLIFEKSNEPFDHVCSGNWQAIGHKIPDLETFSRILRKSGNRKMISFLRKLIIGNLVCIKTCYSFKPTKPFQWPKVQVPKSWYSEITLIDVSRHIDQKLPIFREYFWAIFFL